MGKHTFYIICSYLASLWLFLPHNNINSQQIELMDIPSSIQDETRDSIENMLTIQEDKISCSIEELIRLNEDLKKIIVSKDKKIKELELQLKNQKKYTYETE